MWWCGNQVLFIITIKNEPEGIPVIVLTCHMYRVLRGRQNEEELEHVFRGS